MKLTKNGLVVAGVIALMAVNAKAVVFTMDELLVNEGVNAVTVGDMVFSDWKLFGPINANDVDVTIEMFSPTSYQLRFGGSFDDRYSAESVGASDYRIYYSVSSSSGDPLIDAIEQSFNLTAQGAGGIVAIGETVFSNAEHSTDPVAQSSVGYVYGLTDGADPLAELEQGDQLSIDPSLSKVWVTKDVNAYAAPDSYVGATILIQGFTVGGSTSVPDGGATLTLLGMALLGMTTVRRVLGR